MAATMTYMNRQAEKRVTPARIMEGATRAIVVTRNYENSDAPEREGFGQVAKYARGRDYHDTLAVPLESLRQCVLQLGDGSTSARAFVDAGPVPERELGQRAGLGWIGKNTMLIDPNLGSYFFIAEILTNLDLPIDRPFESDRCGSCRRCLDACPTNAFAADRVLDSTRCISYLTIEHRGEFSDDLELDGWIFGCDVCQTVCPWNTKFARDASDPTLELNPQMKQLELSDVASLSDQQFSERFGKTPLARPGVNGMKRNALRVAAEQSSSDHRPVG